MTEPSLIEQAIIEHWGERCPEYEPGCHACEAWKEYDAITQQNQSPVVTDAMVERGHEATQKLYRVKPLAEPREAVRAALEAALPSGVRGQDFAGDLEPHDDSDKSAAIVRDAYGWTIDGTGRIFGLVAGDMGYAATSIVLDLEDVRLAASDPSHAETVAPYAAALRMIRDAVGELFGPVSDLESEEAVLLRGPEPHHEAEAIIAGLQRVKTALLEAEQRGRRMGMEEASKAIQDELENLTSHDPGVCLDMVLRALQAKIEEVQP